MVVIVKMMIRPDFTVSLCLFNAISSSATPRGLNRSASWFPLKICPSLFSLISLPWTKWTYYSHSYCYLRSPKGVGCAQVLSVASQASWTPFCFRVKNSKGPKEQVSPFPAEEHTALGEWCLETFPPKLCPAPRKLHIRTKMYTHGCKNGLVEAVLKNKLSNAPVCAPRPSSGVHLPWSVGEPSQPHAQAAQAEGHSPGLAL